MNVRKAERGDLDSVLAIEGSWTTTPHWTRKQFESEIDAAGVFLVAESHGDILGYAVAWILAPEAQLLNIAVSPEKKRKGVGRALMRGLLTEGKKRQCTRLTWEVSSENERAIGFYKAFSSLVVTTRPKFYNDGSDAILMDLEIP